MDDDCDVATIGALLADACARTILAASATEPMSAEELSRRCEVSTPTIYRRLERLQKHDLISEQTRPAADGHHYKVYSARLDHVDIDLTSDGFTIQLTRREGMADRFTRFVEELK